MLLILLLISVGCFRGDDIDQYKISNDYNINRKSLILKDKSQIDHYLSSFSKLSICCAVEGEIISKGRAFELFARKGVGLDLEVNGEHYGYLMVVLHAFLDEDNLEGCRHWISLEGLALGTIMEDCETWHEVRGSEINIFGRATLRSHLGMVNLGDTFSISQEVTLNIFHSIE